jgi:hypothetical protein
MKRRWWISAALFGVVITGIALWQESRLREPEHEGRPLGYWVSELRLTVPQRAGSKAGELRYSDIHAIQNKEDKLIIGPKEYVDSSDIPAKAIRSVGTNALPFLLKQLQREPTKAQRILGGLLVKAGLMSPNSGWVSRRFGEGMQSLTAIRLLGTNAAIMLPGFQALTNSRHSDVRMAGELIVRGFSTNPPRSWFNPPL